MQPQRRAAQLEGLRVEDRGAFFGGQADVAGAELVRTRAAVDLGGGGGVDLRLAGRGANGALDRRKGAIEFGDRAREIALVEQMERHEVAAQAQLHEIGGRDLGGLREQGVGLGEIAEIGAL